MSYRRKVRPEVPIESVTLAGYVDQELEAVERTFYSQGILYLSELNVAPTRPRVGMVVLADGVNWNPGAGGGFYGYRAGAWFKLS